MKILSPISTVIKKWRDWIFYLVFATPPVLGTILFLYMFFGNRFSHELIDWAHTGEYFHFIVDAFNLVLLYRLTQVAHKLQEKVSNEEITTQKTNLEKQLKFELFKDFISKIDEYFGKYVEKRPDESAKLYLALITDLADSAKENFDGLIDDINFGSLCDEVSEKITNHIDVENKESYNGLTDSITKIKTMMYHQVKLDTKQNEQQK